MKGKLTVLNLTQLAATAEQKKAGVFDLPEDKQLLLAQLLTFDTLPATKDILDRAFQICDLARSVFGPTSRSYVMINGAAWFIAPLTAALRDRGMEPLFSFYQWEIEEQTQRDGSIRSMMLSKHKGFIGAL